MYQITLTDTDPRFFGDTIILGVRTKQDAGRKMKKHIREAKEVGIPITGKIEEYTS